MENFGLDTLYISDVLLLFVPNNKKMREETLQFNSAPNEFLDWFNIGKDYVWRKKKFPEEKTSRGKDNKNELLGNA